MTVGATARSVADLWPVRMDRILVSDRAESLYRIYLDAFAPLRTRAGARHVLTREEFLDEMRDPRILKYTVWRSVDEPVALATVTNDLDAVPWISPEFYAARHPEHAARRAIYYLGMALVAPQRGQYRILERVVRQLAAACVASHGVLAYDVCSFNDVKVRFGRRAEAALRRIAPVQVDVADTQTYYEAVFE